MNTINLTPTWSGIMPAIIAVLENGTHQGKIIAIEQLTKMAAVADKMVEQERAEEASKTYTVLVQEEKTPFGRPYGMPLIYTIEIPDLSDEDHILKIIAEDRINEMLCLGYEPEPGLIDYTAKGLNLIFAFKGGLNCAMDWRV